MMATGIAALIGTMTMQDSPPPLAPSSAWSIDHGDTVCTLSRSFGPKDRPVTLAIQPPLVDGIAMLVLLVPQGPKPVSDYGSGEIDVSPDRTVKMEYDSQPVPGLGQTAVRVYVEDAVVDTILAVPVLRIRAGKTPIPPIAVTGARKALVAMTQCRTKLMAAWGVDTALWAKAVTRAVAVKPESWIRYDDYPSDAIRAGRQGEVAMIWKIGTDGRLSDCRIVLSSGTPSLDAASCTAMTKRGVYQPARDAGGTPIISWGSRKVRWRLPQH